MPSFWSSVENPDENEEISRVQAEGRSMLTPVFTMVLMLCVCIPDFVAIFWASLSVSSMSFSGSMTLLTNPMRKASTCIDGISGEKQFFCFDGSDESWEPLGSSEARVDPQVDLWLAYLCGGGGDDEVAGHHDFAAASQCVSVHRGDIGETGILDVLKECMSLGCECFCLDGGHGLHLFDVCSCDEGFVFAGEDCDMDGWIVFEFNDCLGEFFDGFDVECIENLWSVHGDGSDPVFLLQDDVLVCHVVSPWWVVVESFAGFPAEVSCLHHFFE